MKQETGVQTWRDVGGKEIAGDPAVSTMGGSTALHRNIKTTVTGQKSQMFLGSCSGLGFLVLGFLSDEI